MVDRQWALKWQTPLPVVNPPAIDQWGAWQNGRIGQANPTVAQDVETTTNQQAGSSWVDAPAASQPQTRVTPASGGGVFGTTYKDPGGGWNPWALYDGREGFDGQAVDGWYDQTRDSPKWELGGRGMEKDRDRVWRWTLDALGPNPGGQDPARVKQVFLEQVARLKRDYQANGMDWANSAFAGYDRMPGTQGGQGQQGQAAQPAAAPSSGQQGGNNVAFQPPAGGNPTLPGNQNPAQPASGGGNGNFGGAGFFNLNNPQQAVRDYMNSHGISPDSNMFFGDWIRKLFGNLVPAVMQLTTDQNGQPALDRLSNLNSLLDPIFYGGGGTLGANLGNFANTAQNALVGAMPGMAADTQADLLRNLTALRTVSTNPYLGSAINNRLDAGIGAAQDEASRIIRSGGQMPQNFSLWDFINNQLPQGYVNPFR